MSQDGAEDITYENIYNLLSHYLRAEHDALWKQFKEEESYKHLITYGEKVYFESPIESTFEEESRKTHMNFKEVSDLAKDVDNVIREFIKKKLEGEFRSKLKGEVLNVLLKLTSQQKRNDTKSSPTQAEMNRKMMDEKAVYEKIKHLSKYCAENINDIRKQVHEMPEEEVIIKTEYEEMETDEIQDDPNQAEESENDSNQQIKNKADTPPPAAAAPENDHPSASYKPQRIRKPNMKYAKDNVVFSPARNSFELDIGNIVSGTNQVTTPEKETPRRRGRSRKHLE